MANLFIKLLDIWQRFLNKKVELEENKILGFLYTMDQFLQFTNCFCAGMDTIAKKSLR